MKILKQVFLWVVIALVSLFLGGSFYVRHYGESFLRKVLERSLKKEVSFERVAYVFPFKVRAFDLRILDKKKEDDFFRAQSVTICLAIETLFKSGVHASSVTIINPVVVIEKGEITSDLSDEQKLVQKKTDDFNDSDHKKISLQEEVVSKNLKNIFIKHLMIKGGQFKYSSANAQEHFSFGLKDFQLRIKDISFPLREGRTQFFVSGQLVKEKSPLSGSLAESSGWIDVVSRNMQGILKVVDSDNRVGLTADVISKNNDMVVKGKIKLSNLFSGAEVVDESKQSTVNVLVSDALSSLGAEVETNFTIETKMDDFQIKKIPFSGVIVTK